MNNILANLFTGKFKKAVEEVNSGKAYLIDVRHDDEWAAGHAKSAIHLDLDELEAGKLPNLPKDVKIYTHCKAGGRAKMANDALKKAGFTNLVCLGGLVDWQKGGGEVVK
jgi:rhodanese-related sulfurtransferase